MSIIRRAIPQEALTMKQVAKLILVFYSQSPNYDENAKASIDPKFKIQETVIQQILGMPLSEQDRRYIVRELNLLGWEVAINSSYWFVFSIRDSHMWFEVGSFIDHSLLNHLHHDPDPKPFGLTVGLNITANEVAKFNGYSDEDIVDELAQSRYHKASDEQIDEFELTGDASVLGIEDDEQLSVNSFTFWQYIDFYLAKKALNRFARLIR